MTWARRALAIGDRWASALGLPLTLKKDDGNTNFELHPSTEEAQPLAPIMDYAY